MATLAQPIPLGSLSLWSTLWYNDGRLLDHSVCSAKVQDTLRELSNRSLYPLMVCGNVSVFWCASNNIS